MQDAAITETFRDVEGLIWKTVNEFRRRFGGDADDLFQEASIAFLRAYRSFDRNKGQLTTLLVPSIRRRLQDRSRYEYRRRQIRNAVSIDEENSGPGSLSLKDILPCPKTVELLKTSLSEDARFVVRVALSPPPRVAVDSEKRGGSIANLRSSIRRHLRDLGWSSSQVRESFREIREAFSNTED